MSRRPPNKQARETTTNESGGYSFATRLSGISQAVDQFLDTIGD